MFIEEEEYEISEESRIIALEEAQELEREEYRQKQAEAYRRRVYEQYKQEREEKLKNETYEEWEIENENRIKKEELLKTFEREFYQNQDKTIHTYEFMSKSTQEDLANSFKKVYHYFASTYYKADPYYPIIVKDILDEMICSLKK